MAFDGVIRHFNDPWPTDWNKLGYFGIGSVVYAVLALCQYRFHWWPLSQWELRCGTAVDDALYRLLCISGVGE